MSKNSKAVSKKKYKHLVLMSVVVLLLILVSGYFVYTNYFSSKVNKYLIENKYYGFKMQTPKGWVAREKTIYSEGAVANLLEECRKNKLAKEIGQFRFQSQKYPDAFGDVGYLPENISSGIILDVVINCIPDSSKIDGGSLKLSGEKAMEIIFDSPEFGRTRKISSLHNGLQYNISKYIYISSSDKSRSEDLKGDYVRVVDKIISSFKFVK